jgi:hypothetical protein
LLICEANVRPCAWPAKIGHSPEAKFVESLLLFGSRFEM